MEVAGLMGRAAAANGHYRLLPGEQQHGRPVYVQQDPGSSRGPSRLVYDRTPGEPAAWMVELPMDPGKAYAYVEGSAQSPAEQRGVWQVWECALTAPIADGKWFPRPAFCVTALEETRRRAGGATSERGVPPASTRAPPRDPVPARINVVGHRYAEYDGAYTRQGECQGYPYYSNPAGRCLFRPVGQRPDLEQWLLGPKCDPRNNECSAYIECPHRAPPLGEHRWHYWDHSRKAWAAIKLRLKEDHVARIASSQQEEEAARGDRQLVEGYARSIGIDPRSESALMWVAEQGLGAPLPAGWFEEADVRTGKQLFVDRRTGVGQFQHPMLGEFRRRADRARIDLDASESGFRMETLKPARGSLSDRTEAALERSRETLASDEQRREEKRELASARAVEMGFAADLVNDVQAEMHCDDVGPLLERLAELTRTEPEPESEPDLVSPLQLPWVGLPNPSNYW